MALKLVQRGLEFGSGGKDVEVQDFVSEFAVEAFDEAVLPRFAGLDESGSLPFWELQSPKLGAVVRDDKRGFAVHQKEELEFTSDFKRRKTRCRAKDQTLPREAVQNGQNPNLTAVLQTFVDKVHAPSLTRRGEFKNR